MTGETGYNIVFYETQRGSRPALEFIEALLSPAQAKIARWLGQLAVHGPDLHRPMSDVLSGSIRELRIGYGGNNYRLLYFFFERTVVITNGFVKKTHSVAHGEIARSERRRADWLSRRPL